jgi:hypothetical protein
VLQTLYSNVNSGSAGLVAYCVVSNVCYDGPSNNSGLTRFARSGGLAHQSDIADRLGILGGEEIQDVQRCAAHCSNLQGNKASAILLSKRFRPRRLSNEPNDAERHVALRDGNMTREGAEHVTRTNDAYVPTSQLSTISVSGGAWCYSTSDARPTFGVRVVGSK